MNAFIEVFVSFFQRIAFDIVFKNQQKSADEQHQNDDRTNNFTGNF